MSGLAGALVLDDAPFDRGFLQRAAEATPYLGPDGADSWSDDRAGFVRYKHATTPQAVHERQPAIDGRAGLVVCFDGRLDNRADLLRTVTGADVDAGSSDSAILLALYAKVGDACVERLVGDYSFAVWQARTRRLFCARAPAGWRPLFWCRHANVIAFATEPKALIEGLPLPRRLDEGAIAEFLALRFATQTDTFWRDLQRLPPGSALVVEDGHVRTWHWHTGPFPQTDDLDEQAHVDRFRHLFDQSIGAVVRSSTPVASHLSGGLDSSSIVCRATQLARTGAISPAVRPISARYPGEPHDETEFSSAVEAHLGIEAAVVGASPYDWDWAADWCGATLQLPLRPNVLGPIVATCRRLHAEGVRVLLTGEGGDDFLRGTRAHWPDLLRRGAVRQLLREGMVPDGGSPARRLGRIARHTVGPLVSPKTAARIERTHLNFSVDLPDWIRSEWADRVALQDRWRSDRLPVDLGSLSQRQRYVPFVLARRHVNVDNVIAFASTQGVELRHPFYDRRLSEFLLGVPGGLLLHGSCRKYLLREAMRGTLPEVVRLRDTKANFTLPFVDTVIERMEGRGINQLEPVRRGWMDASQLDASLSVYRQWRRQGMPAGFPTQPLAPVWSALAIDLWLTHAFKG